MKAIAITHQGIEDITAKEVNELVNSKPEVKETIVLFKINNTKDLCNFCYKSQSIIKTGVLLSEFKADKNLEKTFHNVNPTFEKQDFLKWVKDKKTFKVECKRSGNHDFSSVDISAKITNTIVRKTKAKPEFKTPDIIISVYIHNNAGYLFIDFAGIDLSKRDYKVFAHPTSIKGTIAYALLRIADYKKTETLLDTFTKSGVIPIEAAFFASASSVNYYRKEALAFTKLIKFDFKDKPSKIKPKITGIDSQIKNLKAAEKNAKIAGVKKLINFSRIDVEWLDTKFKKAQIDKLVTSAPSMSKRTDTKAIDKLYKEFFYHAEYILSKKGRLVTINRSPEELKHSATAYNFKVVEERIVWSGKEPLTVLVFEAKPLKCQKFS